MKSFDERSMSCIAGLAAWRDSMHDPRSNQLLAALPAADYPRWLSLLELVTLPLGQVLHEADEGLTHAYFPVDCIISLLYVMQGGESAEIAVIGHEGMVGVPLVMGGDTAPNRAVVQNAGVAYRIEAGSLKADIEFSPSVLHLLLRFTQALMTQMSQTAACNKHHSLTQQLSRWLLLSLDRLRHHRLVITRQLVANMLGVPLAIVSTGTDELHEAGVIVFDREAILVLDRQGLEERTCECYGVVKREYQRLLPEIMGHAGLR